MFGLRPCWLNYFSKQCKRLGTTKLVTCVNMVNRPSVSFLATKQILTLDMRTTFSEKGRAFQFVFGFFFFSALR